MQRGEGRAYITIHQVARLCNVYWVTYMMSGRVVIGLDWTGLEGERGSLSVGCRLNMVMQSWWNFLKVLNALALGLDRVRRHLHNPRI